MHDEGKGKEERKNMKKKEDEQKKMNKMVQAAILNLPNP